MNKNVLDDIKSNFNNGTIEKEEFIRQMHSNHELLFNYSSLIKNTDITRIEITNNLVNMNTKYKNASYNGLGPSFVCDANDHRIAPIEILNWSSYEEDEYEMMCLLINNGDVIFDIGANIGFYSLHFTFQYPESEIYSFEPIPKTYNYLKINVEQNNKSNINIFNHGFSNEEKNVTFYYYPEGSGNASLANLSENNNVKEIHSQVKRLDDQFQNTGANRIDFIKLDVEGAELFVLQGGSKVIEKYQPILFIEMLRKWALKFDYHPNKIILLLKQLGYSCYFTRNNKLIEIIEMTDETEETNFFFLHLTKHKNLIFKSVITA